MEPSFPKTILKREVFNRLPLNLNTAEELGSITDFWVHPYDHQVRGFGCGSGLLGRQSQRFLWSQVVSIGHDGLMVRPETAALAVDEALAECLPLGDLELWSDHGDRVGQLIDFCFDPATGQIEAYHFVASADGSLSPGLYALAPAGVASISRRRLMAHAEAVQAAALIDETVQTPPPSRRPTLDHLPPLPVDRLPDPKQSWEAAVDKTRHAREQVAEQFEEGRQKIQAEAKNRFGGLMGDVKKRTRRLRHQLRETVSDITAGLPDEPRPRRPDRPPTIDVDATELWPEDEDRYPRR